MRMDEVAAGREVPLADVSRKKREQLSEKLKKENRRWGWADLAIGMPDGELMDKVMAGIMQQAGEETDIVRNMEVTGLNLFSKLDQKRIAKGVKFGVVNKVSEENEGWGGWADSRVRETVVVALDGVDRRQYLQWAVNGRIYDIWKFVSAYHEATHSSVFPEVSLRRGDLEAYSRVVTALMGVGAGLLGTMTEYAYQNQERMNSWIGLMAISAVLIFAKTENEKKVRRFNKKGFDQLFCQFDEAGAYLSVEDVGFRAEYDYWLIETLRENDLYKLDWKETKEWMRPEIEEELEELRKRAVVLQEKDSRFGKWCAVQASYRYEDSRTDDLSVSDWSEILSQSEHLELEVGYSSGEERLKEMRQRSKTFDYLFTNPEKSSEGGSWGREYVMHKEALDECLNAEMERLMFEMIDRYRAAGALGLTKYEFLNKVGERLQKTARQTESVDVFLGLVDQVILEKVGGEVRKKVSIKALADEGKQKAIIRNHDLRRIVLEQLEQEWNKHESAAGKTLSWDERVMYITKGGNFGVEIDTSKDASGIRLVQFDEQMRVIERGKKVIDVSELEPIVNETLENLSDEGWKILEEGMQSVDKKKPALPRLSFLPDDSDGELQFALLPKAAERILERWKMSEVRETQVWSKFWGNLLAELRRISEERKKAQKISYNA